MRIRNLFDPDPGSGMDIMQIRNTDFLLQLGTGTRCLSRGTFTNVLQFSSRFTVM
jgi:hypothetical protein